MQTKDVQENGGSSFKECWNIAVWKLQNFSVIQVLREIKIAKSIALKSAILSALNFEFNELWHSLQADIYQTDKIKSP